MKLLLSHIVYIFARFFSFGVHRVLMKLLRSEIVRWSTYDTAFTTPKCLETLDNVAFISTSLKRALADLKGELNVSGWPKIKRHAVITFLFGVEYL